MISDVAAARLVDQLRAAIDSRDETTAETPADPRDVLIVKLYDDLQALTKATAFLNGGIQPVQRVG